MPVCSKLNFKQAGLVFVTTSIRNWLPIFSNEDCAKTALLQLSETAKHYQFSIVGYVIMPTHIHALIGLQDIAFLPQFMRSFKSLSSRKIRNIVETNDYLRNYLTKLLNNDQFMLWQSRYDDLLITSEKQFGIKIEYIHNNPVKAKLVSQADNYLFSSAKDWLTEDSGLIEVDKSFSWLD
jgi:putative transposase